MKWPAFEAPYFLFSEQFSYLYGYRDVYDSINWTSNNDRRKNLLAIPIHEWSRKNYFISPQLFVYMFSGIWTSDSHKYTKNVCMTGHNIKYHQNKRNEMEELEGFSLRASPPPNQHPRSTTVSFSVWVNILIFIRNERTFLHVRRKYLAKNVVHVAEEAKCGIKTCSGETERHCGGVKCHINGVAFAWIRCNFGDTASLLEFEFQKYLKFHLLSCNMHE